MRATEYRADDPAIARWSGEPIKIGPPGMVLTPFVVGPGVTPVITDLTEAVASPELAAMSAIAHGGSAPPKPNDMWRHWSTTPS
jgi:hypothetical protein